MHEGKPKQGNSRPLLVTGMLLGVWLASEVTSSPLRVSSLALQRDTGAKLRALLLWEKSPGSELFSGILIETITVMSNQNYLCESEYIA